MLISRLTSLFLLSLVVTLLPGCFSTAPPSKPFSAEFSPTDPVAEVVEIKNRPVWIKYLNSKDESSAIVGSTIKVGETVRTEANAGVQILLKSGLVLRIEGDSSVTLTPKNSLKLNKGRLIARIAADKNVTAQIQTPLAVASISDTTVYVDLPKDTSKERHIFALQGTVEVMLNGASEPIMLKTGEDLAIKPNGMASQPKVLDPGAIEKRLALNPLLFGFNNKLDSQTTIEANLQISEDPKETTKIPYKRPEPTAYSAPAPISNSPSKPIPPAQPTAKNSDPQPTNSNNPLPSPPVEANRPVPPVVVEPVAPPPPPVQAEPIPIEPPPLPVQPEAGNTPDPGKNN